MKPNVKVLNLFAILFFILTLDIQRFIDPDTVGNGGSHGLSIGILCPQKKRPKPLEKKTEVSFIPR
jgi:hypothetical protein